MSIGAQKKKNPSRQIFAHLKKIHYVVLEGLSVLARAKRERVVQDGVEKANRRPTDPTDTAPLAPYLKFDNF